MTIFWILAAGLIGLASLFIALPLLNRPSATHAPDQDELNLQVFRQRLAELDGDLSAGFLDKDKYEAARQDLERELIYDLDGTKAIPTTEGRGPGPRYTTLALVLVGLVAVGSVLIYLQFGEREIISRIEAMAAAPVPHGRRGPGESAASLDVLAKDLAERMAKDPENLEGWLMLGRTYFAIGQAPKALKAVEQAYRLAPDQTSVLIAYAEAIAANNGNRLEGRPAELIRTVLAKEPGNSYARWLDGMLAHQQGRYAEAAQTWQGILNEMDPDSEEAGQMRQMIAEAQGRAGAQSADLGPESGSTTQNSDPEATPTPPKSSPTTQGTAQTEGVQDASPRAAPGADPGGTSIQVAVSLDPALSDQTTAADTVFVYARAAAGPPMPLAVQRYRVSDLPVSVTLDDSMAMMPAMRLSAFPQIVVGARISKDDQATPQPGDLEGQIGPIITTENPKVSVTIDQVRP